MVRKPSKSEVECPPIKVGILALQGSFALHKKSLAKLGISTLFIRRPEELDQVAGLIIPGGESTVMSDLAREYDLDQKIVQKAKAGMPIFGTCAGAILLGKGEEAPPRLELSSLTVQRNAYGRQRESFDAPVQLTFSPEPFHGIFIRAPRIVPNEQSKSAIEGWYQEDLVLTQQDKILLSTFHPELTEDLRVHEHFIEMVRASLAQEKDPSMQNSNSRIKQSSKKLTL